MVGIIAECFVPCDVTVFVAAGAETAGTTVCKGREAKRKVLGKEERTLCDKVIFPGMEDALVLLAGDGFPGVIPKTKQLEKWLQKCVL